MYVALGLAILILAKYARDIVTRSYRIDEQITKSRNLAVSLRFSGYLMGVVLVFLGALYQPLLVSAEEGFGFNRDFGEDVLKVFLYSLAGIVALNIVRIIVNRLVLYKFDIEKQIVEGQNVGAGRRGVRDLHSHRATDRWGSFRRGWGDPKLPWRSSVWVWWC